MGHIGGTTRRSRKSAADRAAQQAAVAELGAYALTERDVGRLQGHAAAAVARILDVELCGVLELQPDGRSLKLVAGLGWKPGQVGGATVEAGRGSHAGFTLATQGPVLVDDFGRERRFPSSMLLREHKAASGVTAPIAGCGRPFGVLAAHSRRRRRFDAADASFLKAIANTLAAAIQRLAAEARVRAGEERLSLALRSAGAGTWDWNIPEDALDWDEAMHGLAGLRPGTFAGRQEDFLARVHEKDRERVRSEIADAMRRGGELRSEYSLIWPDGTVHVLRACGRLHRDDSGRPVRMIGVCWDVTRRRADEERFRGLLEAAPDAMVIVDQQGRMVLANAQAERLFGYGREELIGRPVEILVPESSRENHVLLRSAYARAPRARPMGSGLDLHGRHKDGRLIPVEISLSPLWTQEGLLVSSAIRDVSKRRAVERRLAAQNAASRVLSASDTIEEAGPRLLEEVGRALGWVVGTLWFFDAQAKGLRCGAQWSAAGTAAERLMEANREATFLPGEGLPGGVWASGEPSWLPDLTASSDHTRRDAAASGSLVGVVAAPIRVGRELWGVMELFSGRREDPDQQLLGVLESIGSQLGLFIERKNAEKAKSEFISIVSHELRTPLTSIRGALGLIVGGIVGELPPEARQLAEIANDNSERLTRLINDILDIEKIESGRMGFDFERLDLKAVVTRSIENMRAMADQAGVTLSLRVDDSPPPVRADADRVVQIATNLLSNAIKFSFPGGAVTVSIAPLDGRVRVSVADQGPGIPEEFRSRVFQRFAQADASTTRDKGGTGLGLSICKALAERMDGGVGFDSRPGEGATFYFELVPWSRLADRDARPARTDRRQRILVCEDDEATAGVLREMLEAAGYVVDPAHTAERARRLLSERSYAALTLDLLLPDGDGLELLNELRAEARTARLPVIVVSIKADEAGGDLRGGALCVEDWIQKPADMGRVLDAVLRVTRGRRDHRPRILHVDDDEDVLRVVASMLGDMADVALATDLGEARALLRERRFDLVLLDVKLADGSGLDLLPELRRRQPVAPVVVFAAEELGREAARAVDAHLVKSRVSRDELRERIAALLDAGRPPEAAAPAGAA